jgi:Rrf2 family protein
VITQKARYAFRALFALAEAGAEETLFISDIAESRRIPRKFLEQILLDLKHHGVVASRRGKNGGYALLLAPAEITFGRVLRIFDGPLAPLPCLSRMAYRRCEDCEDEESCSMRRVFSVAYQRSVEVLDSTTLADAMASGSLPFDGDDGEPAQLTA